MATLKGGEPITETVTEVAQSRADGFRTLWNGLSALWFLVPLTYFLADPFFRQDIVNIVLAISISAAFPLSWHLSLVALPLSSPLLLGLSLPASSLVAIHKFLGYRSAIWGALHAIGEIIYMSKTRFQDLSISEAKGENLIYIFGLSTAIIFLTHLVVVLVCHMWLGPYFKDVHRVIAVVLLVAATAHWWPFAFFLLPTAAAYGASTAGKVIALENELEGRVQTQLFLELVAPGSVVASRVLFGKRSSHFSSSSTSQLQRHKRDKHHVVQHVVFKCFQYLSKIDLQTTGSSDDDHMISHDAMFPRQKSAPYGCGSDSLACELAIWFGHHVGPS